MRRLPLLLAALALLPAAAPAGAAVKPIDPLPTTNGEVRAVTRVGDVIWIGGGFTRVAPRSGPAGLLAVPGGERDTSFPVLGPGTVDATVPDGAGGWYLGGAFDSAGGEARTNLVHVLADGTVDPAFAPNPDGEVKALALSGGTLYIGGLFAHAGGAARDAVAALDAATGKATGFKAPLRGNGFVGGLSLVATPGRLYAGGRFDTPGGNSVNLVALDPATGARDQSFQPEVSDFVNALAFAGGRLYAGVAIFLDANPPLRALDPATGADVPGFSTELDGSVEALVVSGDTLYAGGGFSAPHNGIAKLDATTGAARSFDAHLDSSPEVKSLALDAGRLYFGGITTFEGGEDLVYLASVDAVSGGQPAQPADPPGDIVRSISIAGGKMVVGGEFTSIGGAERRNVAAIDAVDGHLLPSAPNPDDQVGALATDGSRVFAAGFFTTFAGQPRKNLAVFDAHTGALDPAFAAIDPDADVSSLLVDGSRLLLAGNFATVAGKARSRLAAVDTKTGALLPLRADADDRVSALALVDRRLYAVGAFQTIGGKSRNGAALLNADTGAVDAAFQPDGGTELYTVAATRDRVYMGGYAGFGGTPLVAVDAQTGAFDDGFDPQLGRDIIYSLAVDPASLYVGGSFSSIGGKEHAGFAQLDLATGDASDLDLGLDRNAFGVFVEPGAYYAAGDFKSAGGAAQQGFGTFTAAPAATAAPAISGTPAAGQTLTCGGDAFTGVVARRTIAWLRDGAPIEGATANAYTVAEADAGHALTCAVTAANLGGRVMGTSAPVTPPKPPPSDQPGPAGPANPGPSPAASPPPAGAPAPVFRPAVTPRPRLRHKRRSLRALLSRGVPVSLGCTADCRARVELFVHRGHGKKATEVGQAEAGLRTGQRYGIAVALDRGAARALAKRKRPFSVVILARGIDSTGKPGGEVVRRKVRVKP